MHKRFSKGFPTHIIRFKDDLQFCGGCINCGKIKPRTFQKRSNLWLIILSKVSPSIISSKKIVNFVHFVEFIFSTIWSILPIELVHSLIVSKRKRKPARACIYGECEVLWIISSYTLIFQCSSGLKFVFKLFKYE